MSFQDSGTKALLEKGKVMTLPADVEISCTTGSLWVTQENDIRDVVLGPGESCTFDREGPVLAYALKPSQFIANFKREAPQKSLFESLASRFGRHMRGVADRYVDQHRPVGAR